MAAATPPFTAAAAADAVVFPALRTTLQRAAQGVGPSLLLERQPQRPLCNCDRLCSGRGSGRRVEKGRRLARQHDCDTRCCRPHSRRQVFGTLTSTLCLRLLHRQTSKHAFDLPHPPVGSITRLRLSSSEAQAARRSLDRPRLGQRKVARNSPYAALQAGESRGWGE